MEPVNFLDEVVARFRHRWETNPQYRAMLSGVVGLVTIVALCSCGLFASIIANSVFASNGLSGGNANAAGQQQVGGGGGVAGVPTFPTSAVPTWQVSALPPAVVAPTSQTIAPTVTPIPSETAVPTATCPDPSCGGGGGGGGGGNAGTVSASWPAAWVQCSGGSACDTLTIHTSVPNNGVAILMYDCNNFFSVHQPAGTTDGQGDFTFTYNQQGAKTRAKADITITTFSGASAHVQPLCA